MSYRDFEAIKADYPIEQVADRLGLELKKGRCKCPVCESDNDRNLVVTPGKGFYCFADGKGGDCIGLVAHINQLSMKDAAAWIAGDTAEAKPKQNDPKERGGFKPLDYLESDHPAVEAVGFSAEDAERIGVGFAPRGMMRNLVTVPVRDDTGKLLGYIGVTEAKLPTEWKF